MGKATVLFSNIMNELYIRKHIHSLKYFVFDQYLVIFSSPQTFIHLEQGERVISIWLGIFLKITSYFLSTSTYYCYWTKNRTVLPRTVKNYIRNKKLSWHFNIRRFKYRTQNVTKFYKRWNIFQKVWKDVRCLGPQNIAIVF